MNQREIFYDSESTEETNRRIRRKRWAHWKFLDKTSLIPINHENCLPTFGNKQLLYSEGEMHINDIDEFNKLYKGQQVTSYSIKISEDNISKLQNLLNGYVTAPGHYSLAYQQCTSVATNALLDAGVRLYEPHTIRFMTPIISGEGFSPSHLQMVLSSHYNYPTVSRIVRFTVGQ